MEFIIIIIALALIAAISYIIKMKQESSDNDIPEDSHKSASRKQKEYQYQKKFYFFTKNELPFYRDLAKATEGMNLVIFAKTRLADVIEPKRESPNYKASFTKIRSKHLDFVLCALPSINPVLVIELDDNSHDRPDRQQRDTFVDQALTQAGIPVLHVKGSAGIAEKIREALPLTSNTQV